MQKIEHWLQSNGVWWDRDAVEIVPDSRIGSNNDRNGGRVPMRIVSKRPLIVDEIIARIPKSAILSAKNCSIAKLLWKNCIDGAVGLVLAMMYERQLGQESRWYEYLSSIPIEEPLPVLWSPEDRSDLTGTEVEDQLRKDIELLRLDYDSIVVPFIRKYPKRFNSENFHFEEFRRESSVVVSRYFGVDQYHGDSMIPLADMFNHRTAAENIHLESEDDSDWIELRVVRGVPQAGQEVFNTYGEHSNGYLLLKYGFCEPYNLNDCVSVRTADFFEAAKASGFDLDLLKNRVFWWSLNLDSVRDKFSGKENVSFDFDIDGDLDEDYNPLTERFSFKLLQDGCLDPEFLLFSHLLGSSDLEMRKVVAEIWKFSTGDMDYSGLSPAVMNLLKAMSEMRLGRYKPTKSANMNVRTILDVEQSILRSFLERFNR